METCNSGGFLQNFWTINTHNNEEFTIKHWEKKFTFQISNVQNLTFVEGFSGLFCINVTSDNTPWNIFKISEKNLV